MYVEWMETDYSINWNRKEKESQNVFQSLFEIKMHFLQLLIHILRLEDRNEHFTWHPEAISCRIVPQQVQQTNSFK